MSVCPSLIWASERHVCVHWTSFCSSFCLNSPCNSGEDFFIYHPSPTQLLLPDSLSISVSAFIQDFYFFFLNFGMTLAKQKPGLNITQGNSPQSSRVNVPFQTRSCRKYTQFLHAPGHAPQQPELLLIKICALADHATLHERFWKVRGNPIQFGWVAESRKGVPFPSKDTGCANIPRFNNNSGLTQPGQAN